MLRFNDGEPGFGADAGKGMAGRRAGGPAPATDRPGDDPVAEFRRAMEGYRRRSGRPFPTWSEVLEVLKGLGYERARIRDPRLGMVPSNRVAIVRRDGPEAEEIVGTLAMHGGLPLGIGALGLAFPSREARDRALDLARRQHGWTCADPL